MKIVVSPDSFKGSLTAIEVAVQMTEAIKEVNVEIETVLLPVADGGEGTLEPLIEATEGKLINVQVHNPLGRMIEASYGVLGDGKTCVIEMAKASGLPLLAEHERNPFKASSFGTGEMILHALDQGYREFIIGIGGSATNDGGTGMLQALGVTFSNTKGEVIQPREFLMEELGEIDLTYFDSRIIESKFTVACDVDNPFVGPNGATAVFGPQKGVIAKDVPLLDQKLVALGDKIEEKTGIRIHESPGAGAAGGLGGALLAFFPVELKPGIDVVMEAIHFKEKLKNADLVITGEGKSDRQTLAGKAPLGVAKLAKEFGIPTICISGMVEDKELLSSHFWKIASVVDGFVSKEDSMNNPGYYVRLRTKEVLQTILEEKR